MPLEFGSQVYVQDKGNGGPGNEIVLTDERVSCAARFWDVTQWAAEKPKDERAGRRYSHVDSVTLFRSMILLGTLRYHDGTSQDGCRK